MRRDNKDIDPYSDMTFHDVVLKGRIRDKAKTKKRDTLIGIQNIILLTDLWQTRQNSCGKASSSFIE
jgi:hypothetical protein